MKVGSYQIGRYHAIIKCFYEDGTCSYETSFSSRADALESVCAIRRCIGKVVGTATDNPKVLVDMEFIAGKESIERELK